MKATEEDLRSYIEIFHITLKDASSKFLTEEQRDSLHHHALLPSHIKGFLSAQFGVAIEYCNADASKIEIVSGKDRIEDLMLRPPAAAKFLQPAFVAREPAIGNVASTGFSRMRIKDLFPFRVIHQDAEFHCRDVAFQIGQWLRPVQYAEIYGNSSAEFWSTANAISRANNEVLAAVLDVKRAAEKSLDLFSYINKYREKTVLLLGSYDAAGLSRLENFKMILAVNGYDSILIQDIPDQPAQDLPQKVRMIAALSKFIIIDDTEKSGHLSEVEICKQGNWITVLMRAGGKGASWMTAGAAATSNVILEQAYDENDCSQGMLSALGWAETKVVELQRKFDSTFPWRPS